MLCNFGRIGFFFQVAQKRATDAINWSIRLTLASNWREKDRQTCGNILSFFISFIDDDCRSSSLSQKDMISLHATISPCQLANHWTVLHQHHHFAFRFEAFSSILWRFLSNVRHDVSKWASFSIRFELFMDKKRNQVIVVACKCWFDGCCNAT